VVLCIVIPVVSFVPAVLNIEVSHVCEIPNNTCGICPPLEYTFLPLMFLYS